MNRSLADWISQLASIQRRSSSDQALPPASDRELDEYFERVKLRLDIAKQQSDELSSERKKRQRAERDLADARSRLKESNRSLNNNRRELRRVSRQLNSLQYGSELPVVTELRQELDELQQLYSDALEEERSQRANAEARLATLEKRLKAIQLRQSKSERSEIRPIPARVAEERDRRRKAEKAHRTTKRQLKHANRTLKNLRRDIKRSGKHRDASTSNGAPSSNGIFQTLLPNLTLARDSADRLKSSREAKQIFGDLNHLNDNPQVVRGERVGAAGSWLELRPSLTSRIYYRNGNRRGQYLVLIGDKNTQPNDLDWLKRNK